MDFIFMLTRADQTVEDCLDVLDVLEPVALQHIGFKDVGVDPGTLAELNRRIKQRGATSYMEVVSTDRAACLNSVRVALDIGVDRLLGGNCSEVDEVLRLLEGSATAYLPFPGFPSGHPTRLGGTPHDIATHCREYMDKGCLGADLLAWRTDQAEPLALVQAARNALGAGYLVVAGSIDTPQKIDQLAVAGVDAFTIGSALFDGSYAPRKGALQSQVRAVLAACRAV
jgi:hypothetical protein